MVQYHRVPKWHAARFHLEAHLEVFRCGRLSVWIPLSRTSDQEEKLESGDVPAVRESHVTIDVTDRPQSHVRRKLGRSARWTQHPRSFAA
jgi:hypothetical protein